MSNSYPDNVKVFGDSNESLVPDPKLADPQVDATIREDGRLVKKIRPLGSHVDAQEQRRNTPGIKHR